MSSVNEKSTDVDAGEGASEVQNTVSKSDVKTMKVKKLKEELEKRGLDAVGKKCVLRSRLEEAIESENMNSDDEGNNTVIANNSDESDDEDSGEEEEDKASDYQRNRSLSVKQQAERLRKEKELAERELDIARREIEILKREQQIVRSMSPVSEGRRLEGPKMSIAAVADLLDYFDGTGTRYEQWERQVRLLQTTYRLSPESCKVLIASRLKGRAIEWFHSKPSFIDMPLDEFFKELRGMFYRQPSKAIRRKQFEERTWRNDETFNDYFHGKVILANNVPIDEDELIDYLIEGIPDLSLRDQAYIQRFDTKTDLLEAFEKVPWRGKSDGIEKKMTRGGNVQQSSREKTQRTSEYTKRCHSCGSRSHLAAECPTKEKGVKCFECRGYGHIASSCPKKKPPPKNSCNVSQTANSKYTHDVKINDKKIAALIDTGSDLSLMRAETYVRIGAPRLQNNKLTFRGIGSDANQTLGDFKTDVCINGDAYPITLYVVSDRLMQPELLLGADFLRGVNLELNNGKISFAKVEVNVNDSDNVPEIFQISVCETDTIDTSYIVDRDLRSKVQRMINEYNPIGTRKIDLKMSIVVKDEEPVYQRARRLSPVDREEVNRQISTWLNEGIVQPSLSEYASPIVLVKKKDGSKRLCVDYRQLNKKVVRDRYPLPLIEDQLDLLQGASVFSTIDLKNAFFHVPIDKDSRKYTAFIVPDGQYEFLKVPFGLSNSPAIFQKFINAVFRELISKNIVLTYLDDLIVPSVDLESGLEKLRLVLNTAAGSGLIINWKKCKFLQQRVEFLGHIIENGSVRPSEEKTKAVLCFPTPRTTKQLQSFLGLSGYFRKFVPHYSIIARPLTNLLKANTAFHFGEEQQHAFDQLKSILSDKPVLRLYKVDAETELHTDASKYGYGAVLVQRDSEDGKLHPIYYASGKTTDAESKYCSYELEILAIIRALRRFRVYLLGIHFKIITDCKAFTLTMSKKDLCVRVARWALLLEEFNYVIEHRPGKNMNHVDALSRNPLPTCMLINCKDTLTFRFQKAQSKDTEIQKMVDFVNQGKLDGYIMKAGLLFKRIDDDLLLVVPKTMQTQIIRDAHERGHFSVAKTEALIKKDFYIPSVRPKIEKVLENCVTCILANRKTGKQEGLLNSLEKGEVPLDTYHVDHLGPLPSTRKNYKHILVVIDAFSKYIWLYATKTTNAAEVVNRLENQAIVFGNPRRIITDRGAAFTSKEFKEYCENKKIKHNLICTGIPRSNGQVERVNRTLISVLTKLADPKREEWYRHLNLAQRCLNTTMQRSIGTTPFHLLFGVHPRLDENPEIRELLEREWISEFRDKRDEIRISAKEAIAKVQDENKRNYNRKRVNAHEYNINDVVAIKRTQRGPGLKLANKFLGPYRVARKLRHDRYVVEKIGNHEGPVTTSTAADHMKPWACDAYDSLGEDNEDPEIEISHT